MTFLIAGGGTGGHVFPMVAVGDAIRAEDPSANVFYVGTARGLEAKVLPARGDDLELLDVAPLRGAGLGGFIRGAFRASQTLLPARKLLKSRKPDVVLSVGGYAAGPVALAAWAMGIPVALLEPNGVLGLSNRLLAPFAARAYTGFGDPAKSLSKEKVRNLGVPLRSAFASARYQPENGRFNVLVLGGSQGATALNAALPETFQSLQEAVPFATIVHQTGRGKADPVRVAYEAAGVEAGASVVEFIDDVSRALGNADVVVQRAGASSLAELCVVGRPSVLVPFPFAADQHQLANAKSMAIAGAARLVEQRDATPSRLAGELIELANDAAIRVAMAGKALGLGRPDAAKAIARDLRNLAMKKGSVS